VEGGGEPFMAVISVKEVKWVGEIEGSGLK
jgi:hypothetical protein